MKHIKFGARSFRLPQSRTGRLSLGGAFIIGGMVGFLPVLGFWMIPVGFAILSIDLPAVRRLRRRITVAGLQWWRRGARADR